MRRLVATVVICLTVLEATALDLRLLQRAWPSSDAQNEHEKGDRNRDAHFTQVVRGEITALWLCRICLKHRRNARLISCRCSKKNAALIAAITPRENGVHSSWKEAGNPWRLEGELFGLS